MRFLPSGGPKNWVLDQLSPAELEQWQRLTTSGDRTAQAAGSVVGVRFDGYAGGHLGGAPPPIAFPTIEFHAADGTPHRFESLIGKSGVEVGDVLQVQYNPSNPEDAVALELAELGMPDVLRGMTNPWKPILRSRWGRLVLAVLVLGYVLFLLNWVGFLPH